MLKMANCAVIFDLRGCNTGINGRRNGREKMYLADRRGNILNNLN